MNNFFKKKFFIVKLYQRCANAIIKQLLSYETQSAYGFSTKDGFRKVKHDKRTLRMIASYLLDV